MTGVEVQQLRAELGVRTATFAALCGVTVSTISRWEASPGPVKAEPFARSMLAILQGLPEPFEMGPKLERAYETNGALYAIWHVLRMHFTGR